MASNKRKHTPQIDPETGERFIIKDNGQRQKLPTSPNVWRPVFLAALAESGNVLYSAMEAKISTQTAYRAKTEDEAFAQQWAEALRDSTDLLEAVARDRAVKGSDRLLMFLLAAHRPEVYGKAAAQQNGVNVEQAQIHIYLPDNGRQDGARQISAASEDQVIDVTPEPVHPEHVSFVPDDTAAEQLEWLKQQPWFGKRKVAT